MATQPASKIVETEVDELGKVRTYTVSKTLFRDGPSIIGAGTNAAIKITLPWLTILAVPIEGEPKLSPNPFLPRPIRYIKRARNGVRVGKNERRKSGKWAT